MDIDLAGNIITPTSSTTLTIGSTGALGVPIGSTAQRPSVSTSGFYRFNSDLGVVEVYLANNWQPQPISINIDAVRCATTTNLTLTSPGSTIDGVTMVAGDRVLVKDQTTLSQNGIYIWNGSTSTMTRADDMSTSWNISIPGRIVFCAEGTVSEFFNYRFVTAFNGTIGTTDITVTGGWQQSGRITFGDSSTPTRAATGSTTPTDFQLIDTTANMRTWKFSAGGTSVVTGLEMAIGNNNDVTNAANTWWDMSLSSDTQEGVRFARRTGGTVAPKLFLDLNGRLTVGNSVLASGATGAALATTAGIVAYFNSTDAIKLPVGTTVQQPTTSSGLLRFNSTTTRVEYNDGANWQSVAIGKGIIQLFNGTFTLNTGTTEIPADNTIPQSTEGSQVWTQAITPISTSSVIELNLSSVFGNSNIGEYVVAALFRGTTCLTVQAFHSTSATGGIGNTAGASISSPFGMSIIDSPATTSVTTYSLRIGRGGTAGTWYFGQSNSNTTLITFSGLVSGNWIIKEIL